MKFIHAADLHLDSPLRNLERYEGAPTDTIRAASRRALENLVALAIDREVDFVVIAGDLFDGDWQDYNSGLFFHRQMIRLREAAIPVISISGNHDAQGKMTKSLDFTGIVHELPTDEATTLTGEQLGIEHSVAIHGRGFANAVVNENVARDYPPLIAGCFNIGVLHTSLESDASDHARYAPCSIADLTSKGYDYWALGHIHNREVKHESPWIVYPGNLQGRHIKEEGAKGCYFVEVDTARNATLSFEPLDVFRWKHLTVDVTNCETPADAIDRFGTAVAEEVEAAKGRPLAMRVTLLGACEAHRHLAGDRQRQVAELQAKATEIGAGRVWLEKIRFDTRLPIDAEAMLDDDGPLAELRVVIEELRTDEDLMHQLTGDWTNIANRLPPELLRADSPEAVRLNDPEYLRGLLSDVDSLLIDRLSKLS